MTMEKAQIISTILADQAKEALASAEAASKEFHEHKGAEQALRLLGKEMPVFAANIEKRIEGDSDLGDAAKTAVRQYAKNIIARFQVMCEGNANHQMSCQLRTEGRMQTFTGLAKKLGERSELEIAKARRREEVEAERELANDPDAANKVVKRAAEEVDKVAEKVGLKKAGNGTKKKRKSPTKRRAAKKKTDEPKKELPN